jgi:hypothetical protein
MRAAPSPLSVALLAGLAILGRFEKRGETGDSQIWVGRRNALYSATLEVPLLDLVV